MDAAEDRQRRRRDARSAIESMIDAVLQEAEAAPWPTPGAPAPPPSPRPTAETTPEARPSEPRVLFVDGFNVLHATLDADGRERAWWTRGRREALLARMTRWPDAADEIWVVFDGPSPAWSCWAEPVVRAEGDARDGGEAPASNDASPTVHCVFVENADDWIVRRARRAAAPERTIVVSRDHQVAGRARSAGCRVWSPGELLARCPDRSLDGSDRPT